MWKKVHIIEYKIQIDDLTSFKDANKLPNKQTLRFGNFFADQTQWYVFEDVKVPRNA